MTLAIKRIKLRFIPA